MSRFVSLAGSQVAELADRAAEAGRLSRGRTLFRKGSVADLSVSEGSIIASVRGSSGDMYETTVGTALAPPGVVRQLGQARDPENPRSIEDLIGEGLEICPRDLDLVFGCDCADWDEPCKHVVAVILAFADRVDLDEAELLLWRGIDPTISRVGDGTVQLPEPPTERRPGRRWRRPETSSDPGSDPSKRAAPHDKDGHESGNSSDEDGDRSATLTELEALLGDTVMRVPSSEDPGSDRVEDQLDPTMAAFLGIGMTIEPIDVSEIPAPAPLFTEVHLGPLADLGPELAKALATIVARTQPS